MCCVNNKHFHYFFHVSKYIVFLSTNYARINYVFNNIDVRKNVNENLSCSNQSLNKYQLSRYIFGHSKNSGVYLRLIAIPAKPLLLSVISDSMGRLKSVVTISSAAVCSP